MRTVYRKKKERKKGNNGNMPYYMFSKNCSISSSIMFLSKKIMELQREYNSVNDNIMKVLG